MTTKQISHEKNRSQTRYGSNKGRIVSMAVVVAGIGLAVMLVSSNSMTAAALKLHGPNPGNNRETEAFVDDASVFPFKGVDREPDQIQGDENLRGEHGKHIIIDFTGAGILPDVDEQRDQIQGDENLRGEHGKHIIIDVTSAGILPDISEQ